MNARMIYSYDMVHWELSDSTWTANTASQLKGIGRNLWAPQVLKLNDCWLMYLTCYNSSSNCAIVVLRLGDTFPTETGGVGGWQYVRTLVSTSLLGLKDVIDPCVVRDSSSGRVWMFFGSTGGMYRIELTSDGMSLASGTAAVAVAGLTINDDPTRSQVFEGAYLYQHDGYWYLFVSSGLYSNASYALKVGRSKSLTGTFVDRNGNKMTEGYASTLLSTPNAKGTFWGPGHCSEILTDLEGHTYMYYHSHTNALASTSDRALMLQQIMWDDSGWPYFEDGAPAAEGTYPCTTERFDLTISAAKWATLYVPLRIDVPNGLKAYSITQSSGAELSLISTSTIEPNHPYLIYAAQGSYTLHGHPCPAIDGLQSGLLLGTYQDLCVPRGNYVLQSHDGMVAFYQVTTDDIYIQPNRAYMCRTDGIDAPVRPIASDDAASIFSIDADPRYPVDVAPFSSPTNTSPSNAADCYSLLGHQSPRKGLIILKTADGSYKALLIKE